MNINTNSGSFNGKIKQKRNLHLIIFYFFIASFLSGYFHNFYKQLSHK